MEFIISTMQSPEFWKSAVGFGSALGIVLSPAQANAIVAAGLALMGLINAFKHITRNKP